MIQGHRRFIVFLLVWALVVIPLQSVFACSSMAMDQGLSISTNVDNGDENSAMLSHVHHKDYQDNHHCSGKTHCMGDHCGQSLVLLNASTDFSPILNTSLHAVEQHSVKQLVVSEELRPPIHS